MDKTMASFFYEKNDISFNVADSSSFARMIEENMRFAKQNPFQSYKAPSLILSSGKLLNQADKSTEQPAIAKKFGATIPLDEWSDALRQPILNFMGST